MADSIVQGLEALAEEMAPKALSREIESRGVDMEMLREDLGLDSEMDQAIEDGLQILYGAEFPYLKETEPTEDDWVDWGKSLWDRHEAGVQKRLHLVERNRLFRKNIQWISAVGTSGWREPPKPKETARVVYNLCAPALDQRSQIISEQRPGFKMRPATGDPDDVKKSEASQYGVEYQWNQQGMDQITREASYWSGTDGVVFPEVYWDPDRGPWHEAFAQDEQGNQIALGPTGEPSPSGRPHSFQLGDLNCRVRRIEQVRVSANATATERPWYWIVRDVMSTAEAVREYGYGIVESVQEGVDSDDDTQTGPVSRLGYILPDKYDLLQEQDTVHRFTIYCEPSEYLNEGLTLVIVGKVVVFIGPLLCGKVPIFRWADGSTDPSFYPEPIMDTWIDAQMRINAVLSKWVENVRLNAGPKLLAKRQSLASETLLGGTMTVIEAKGLGPIGDIVRPLEGFSLSADAQKLLEIEMKHFEDLSGYNDTSRGQFSAQQSGRSILAIREQLERIFAPPVMAAATAMTEWAKISLAFMTWGYDLPRQIGVQGKGRPDLVRAVTGDDMDGSVDIWVDPETLMPLPRAVRLQLLDEAFAKGLIAPDEYRRRHPMSWIRDMEYPDEAHVARAKRTVEALRNGQWLPVLPMDNAQIHLDILQRELLLDDSQPNEVRALAFQRWQQLTQLMMMQMSGMVPPAPPAFAQMQPPQGQGAAGPPLNPATQPFQGTNPPVAAGTLSQLGGETDENRVAREFDQRTQR